MMPNKRYRVLVKEIIMREVFLDAVSEESAIIISKNYGKIGDGESVAASRKVMYAKEVDGN